MELIDGLFWLTVMGLGFAALDRLYLKRFFTPEEGEDKRRLICPRCASTELSGLKYDWYWLKRFGPIMGVYKCLQCGYEGLPVTEEGDATTP